MRFNHSLHLTVMVSVAFITALVLQFLTGFVGGYFYTLGYMTPYLVLPASILLIGVIVSLTKRKPNWRSLYTIAWIVYGLLIGMIITGTAMG